MRDGDLAWTAERYVLGELPDAEAAVFEQTLSESQAAREAVADAVALCGAAAGSQVRTSIRWRVSVSFIGAAAACIVVTAAAYFSPRFNQLADATPRMKTSIDAGDWILQLPEMLQDQTAMHQAEADDLESEIESASGVINDDDELPEWLIYVTAAKEGAP